MVVTATRRQESIQNTPFNLAAVTSDMLQEMQVNKIDDIAAYLPGVSVHSQGAYQSGDIVTRGLNVSRLDPAYGGATGVGGAVATYFGEVPLYFDFRSLDLERVEALLGPQGTLYGAGTLGGVIRYIPKQPNLSNFEAGVHVRTTDQYHAPQMGYDGDGVINVPLIDGTLGFRAVVGYYHDPGFIDNTRLVRVPGVSIPQPDFSDPSAVAANLYTERGVNFDHTLTARGELLFRPNDKFEAELTYLHERTKSDGADLTRQQPGAGSLFSQVLGTGPYEDSVRLLESATRTADLGSLVLTGHFGFANLTSATSYAKRTVAQYGDATDGYLTYGSYANFPAFVANVLDEDNRTQFTEELRLVSNGNSRLNWIVGGFYSHFKVDQPTWIYTPGYPAYLGINRPDQLQTYSDTLQMFSDRAVFGEVGYQFTPKWQATVGGRWFKDETHGSTSSAYPLDDGSGPNELNLDVMPLTGPAVATEIYKFNTSYHFTPAVMAYATVSDGYRAGGINGSIPACTTTVTTECLDADQLSFKPDRTRNYEVGLRSTWFDKRLLINADFYYIDWRDLRIQAKNNHNATFLTNGSEARSYGFESQFQAQLSTHLQLIGSYTHADAYLTKLDPNVVGDLNGRYDGEPGDRLPDSPRDMGALHLRISQNLSDGYQFSATYGVKAQSSVFSSIGLRASGEILPGYALHDASLGLSRNNWNATFFVENIFNKYAFTGMGIDRSWMGLVGVNGNIVQSYYHSVLAPRVFGLEFSVHFGQR